MLKSFKALLGIGLLLGSVIMVYYLAYVKAKYGYEAGSAGLLPWGLGFASLACFVWAKKWILPLVLYGVCILWLLVTGGLAYVLVYALMFGLSLFLWLFARRRKKAVAAAEAKAEEEAEAKLAGGANPKKAKDKSSALVCPNPRCKSQNIKVVGAGATAKRMCVDCGKLF